MSTTHHPRDNESRRDQKNETLLTGDKPLGDKSPGAPFMLVGLSYLSVLIVVALAIAFFVWAF